MSWSRRGFLAALPALAACGFTPAYGPQGGAQALQGAFAFPEPDTRAEQLLVRRLEERLGRAAAPRLTVSLVTEVETDGLGRTAEGRTTRFQRVGTTALSVTDPTGVVLHSSTVSAFVGYSTTGTTVATLAAERDAEDRLMTILADRIVDRLILVAPELA